VVFVAHVFLIGFLLIIGTVDRLSAQQQRPLKFSNLSVDDGLSHTDITAIKQDKFGFIWIGTLFGLDRFDGYKTKLFYNANEPKHSALKNRIKSICLAEDGNIWIGSEDGIQYFDPRTEKYTDVLSLRNGLRGKTCSQLFVRGEVLTAFVDGQLRLFNIKGKTLKNIPLNYPKGTSFNKIVPDSSGNFWLAANDGLWFLDRSLHFKKCVLATDIKGLDGLFFNQFGELLITAGNVLTLMKPSGQAWSDSHNFNMHRQIVIPGCNSIRDLVQDGNLNYWVSTYAGLFWLDSQLKIRQIVRAGTKADSFNSNHPDHLLIDRSQCLWVTTWAKGINICDLNAKPFFTLKHTEDQNSLSGNYIRSMLGEADSKIWIGTNGQGLNAFDPKTHKVERYNSHRFVKLKTNQINAMVLDPDRNLWIGTENGIKIINSKRDRLLEPVGYSQFPTHPISSLVKDCYGNIWFGSYDNGFGSIIRNKQNVYQVNYRGNGSAHNVWADDVKPELFVSTTNGLLRLLIDSVGNVIKTFRYQVTDSANSLSSNYVFQVQKKNDSTYWVGTIGGGLNCLTLKKNNNYSISRYGNEYGIFNDVEAFEFDNTGNIWMGGRGLARFNTNSKLLTRFDKNDGLQGNGFKIGASYAGRDGRLYFGGMNGLNYFFPDSIKTNPVAAHPVFTGLLINNISTIVGKTINYCDTLYLNYLQNNFVISFSAMHYANPKKCQYRYKLIGYDTEWKFTDGSNPTATYSNLDFNDYSFVVEATNNDGVWSKNKKSIVITVSSPWWKSTFAKVIYFLIVLSGLVGIYIYQARWFRLKRELSLRELEEQKQGELYQQQLKLNQQIQEKIRVLNEADEFKNNLVSILAHDFRSPLCSTIDIVRFIRRKHDFEKEELEQIYNDIEKDATQMLDSFDIVLQWIRQQLSGYQFKPETLNLYDLFNETAGLFSEQLEAKKIVFINEIPDDVIFVADKEMLQFVNRNLLSNAIKFSPENGRIIIGCTATIREVIITVSDDGPGLDQVTLDKLFAISRQPGASTQMGAGIALSMCRDFVAKMDGRIWAKNKQPTGCVFYYSFPNARNSK